MLFRRRHALTMRQRMRRSVWPTQGWPRSIRYLWLRVLRLSGTPYGVAMGFAIGVAAGMTPFFGFHVVIALVFAFLAGGNLVAAALGTVIGNPITHPFLWLASFEIGRAILGWFGSAPPHQTFAEISHALVHERFADIWPIVKPILIGMVPIATISGTIAFVAVYLAARAFQEGRRERLATRRDTLRRNGQ